MNIIKKKKLSNGMALTVRDMSRKVAGDRWNVKVDCEAAIPVAPDRFNGRQEDAELLEKIRARMGDTLVFSVTKERHFVAEDEKDAVLAGLVQQLLDNAATYIDRPDFPEKLFVARYEDARKHCQLVSRMQPVDSGDEDDGPADFSACFRD